MSKTIKLTRFATAGHKMSLFANPEYVSINVDNIESKEAYDNNTTKITLKNKDILYVLESIKEIDAIIA